MKSVGIVREVDELGRLVVPIETRRVLNWQEGDAIEFFYDDEKGVVMARRYRVQECMFCRDTTGLQYYKQHFVCSNCRNDLSEILNRQEQEGSKIPG
ncbi:AbrB/MazE/SpoVT family DNA-binding domain-containing protein [Paenibacillus sp. GYB003]|uniref:AbrB/MazE/SpoVT family DNA-binding domain-containing protein n=1 Tax=Paenibacillus sp. GYB003 TaxID=2994392 RepID=UPI002F965515